MRIFIICFLLSTISKADHLTNSERLKKVESLAAQNNALLLKTQSLLEQYVESQKRQYKKTQDFEQCQKSCDFKYPYNLDNPDYQKTERQECWGFCESIRPVGVAGGC